MTASNSVQPRKYLSIDALIQGLRERFEAIPDPRRSASTDYSLADSLMAAFAMFSLKEVKQRFSWVTQLKVDSEIVLKLVRGGRTRWKIENETFNTLKNQGYHLDHNFGHGKKHLSTVFATLMLLAFLVDQVQQLSCPLFAKAMGKFNTRCAYWNHLRSCFESFELITWVGLYQAIIDGMTD